ncbi:MAG: hypothetical protein EBU33_09085 [Sphingobacteriia bacterium]|nr:hypothetical protein [Sphingobacteriia bacterium]
MYEKKIFFNGSSRVAVSALAALFRIARNNPSVSKNPSHARPCARRESPGVLPATAVGSEERRKRKKNNHPANLKRSGLASADYRFRSFSSFCNSTF